MVRLNIRILFSDFFFPSYSISEVLTQGMLGLSIMLWGGDIAAKPSSELSSAAGETSAGHWSQVLFL